ncbi:UNVERIFIED_CONTAM: hypothetical protein Sradi_2532300 [Sesamum radiatum]|uniref:Secreted protein n=1 Tax=Sesamum radiatum TaxID=300843 RepID=A0AAW2SKS3_SESRA
MCMSSVYMFLTMVIPDPSNPKRLICVLGVIDRRAAAVVACTFENVRPCHKSDFHDGDDIDVDYERLPAYGMESGWSTAGVMGCPICMDDTRAFHL